MIKVLFQWYNPKVNRMCLKHIHFESEDKAKEYLAWVNSHINVNVKI